LLGQLLLDRGRYGQAQILSPTRVTAMTSPHARVDDGRGDYGCLTWLSTFIIKGARLPRPRCTAMRQQGRGRALVGAGGRATTTNYVCRILTHCRSGCWLNISCRGARHPV